MPLWNVTVMVPCSPAPATTWLLVRMWPSLSSTMPLPMPPLPLDCTAIVTSDGSIFAAAAATVPFRVGLCGAAALVTFTGEAVCPFEQEGVRANAGAGTQHGGDRRAGDQGTGSAFRPLQNRRSARGSGVQRRNTCRCGKVGAGVAAVLTARQDDGRLLIRSRWGLRIVREVWGVVTWLLVCVHGNEVARNPMSILCGKNELAERVLQPAMEPPTAQPYPMPQILQLRPHRLLGRRPQAAVDVGVHPRHDLAGVRSPAASAART